jgi:endonuclease/exonuclease/phosphatase family metal-dependent hydrolase
LLKPGRMKEIMEEIGKARVDVVAVQEIRWQGQGRTDITQELEGTRRRGRPRIG